jgi:hypothetical protein
MGPLISPPQVAELVQSKRVMEEHSRELVEELRASREQTLAQLSAHAAAASEAAARRREQQSAEAAERGVASEAWASRVLALQEELGSLRLQLASVGREREEERSEWEEQSAAAARTYADELSALHDALEGARGEAEALRASKESLRDLLSRARTPPASSPLKSAPAHLPTLPSSPRRAAHLPTLPSSPRRAATWQLSTTRRSPSSRRARPISSASSRR